jgi:hypothetical protein
MPDGNRIELPLQTRLAPISGVDAKARTFDVVWSLGARVQRYDWLRDENYLEELSMDPAHVRLDRLRGGAPLLDTHSRWSVRDIIGVVESASVDGKQGTGTVRMSDREDVQPIVRDVENKIIRNVSVGYKVHKVERSTDQATGMTVLRAIDWEPMELSLVPVGADAGAGVRDDKQKTFPCEIVNLADSAVNRKEPVMSEAEVRAAAEEAAKKAAAEEAARKALADAERAAVETERTRGVEIRKVAKMLRVPDAEAERLVTAGTSLEKARVELIEARAKEDAKTVVRGVHIETVTDEDKTRHEMMSAAVLHRVNPKEKLPDGAREYRNMSLLRLAEDCLERNGIRTRGLTRLDIATRALHLQTRDGPGMMAGGDFANVLADVANKRLRQAYIENPGSYQRWARRAPNAPDFKNLNVIQLSSMPDLLQTNEHGEFKYGTLSDGKETYSLITYGRIVSFTRQSLINDDLSAFDRVTTGFGASAARLENRTVYAILTANAALADGVALFHATHANTGTSGVISVTTLTEGRKKMRLQKGLQSEELNLMPAYLIVPAAIEHTAYQFTSTLYLPAKSSDINEFRTGGRTAIEPIVEAVLDASSSAVWYLAADNAQVDTVEYCFLDGSEGVFMESEMGFDVDGMKLKARLDFATKAIDYRGLLSNAGV